MNIAVKIFDPLGHYSDTERAVAEEQIAAKLEQHAADSKRYLRPSANAATAARLAQNSDASLQAGDGNKVVAGDPTVPANPAFSLASEEEQLGAEQQEAVVAWDLTLRCPRCNSNVEGNRRKYHCFSCARRGR